MSRRPLKWRYEFIADATRHGLNVDHAKAWLRIGATAQRLTEAQCNGDWPADNGDKDRQVPCAECESRWHKSAILKDGRCVDCRTTDRARAMLLPGWTLECQGDPRGCIFTLVAPDGARIGVP